MENGKPVVIKYESKGGVMLHIAPLSIATVRAIQIKAAELFPFPKKAEYELPLEDAADPSIKDKAENNPEYMKLVNEITHKRNQWTDWAVYEYCVTYPNLPNKEAVVQQFGAKLNALRKIATVQEDDYEAIVRHIILPGTTYGMNSFGKQAESGNEFADVIALAMQVTPLTEDETTDGIRFFRPDVSGRTHRALPRNP